MDGWMGSKESIVYMLYIYNNVNEKFFIHMLLHRFFFVHIKN